MLCDCSWITMSQWMMKTAYEGESPLRVLQMRSVLGERRGLGAGLAVTDCTFALGGWHKALRCLGSCGLPAKAGAVPFWSKPCFQTCLGRLLAFSSHAQWPGSRLVESVRFSVWHGDAWLLLVVLLGLVGRQ